MTAHAQLDMERDRQRARVVDGLDRLIEAAALLADEPMRAVLVDAKRRILDQLSAENRPND